MSTSQGWDWARGSHGNVDAAPVSQQSAGFPASIGSHQRHNDTLLVPPLRPPTHIAFKSSLGHDVIMTNLAEDEWYCTAVLHRDSSSLRFHITAAGDCSAVSIRHQHESRIARNADIVHVHVWQRNDD